MASPFLGYLVFQNTELNSVQEIPAKFLFYLFIVSLTYFLLHLR